MLLPDQFLREVRLFPSFRRAYVVVQQRVVQGIGEAPRARDRVDLRIETRFLRDLQWLPLPRRHPARAANRPFRTTAAGRSIAWFLRRPRSGALGFSSCVIWYT